MAAEQEDSLPLLKNRYAIQFEQRLTSMDTAGAVAFACTDIKDSNAMVYALVPRDGVPFRDAVLSQTLARSVPHVLSPLAKGNIALPEGGWLTVAIVPYPAGGPVANVENGEQVTEYALRHQIIPQLLAAIENLAAQEITHRGIRPDRLFYLDSGRTMVTLGECFSEPPALTQPRAFEPLERAPAQPAGRGEGDVTCDLFALGVTVLSLLVGRLPETDTPREELLRRRVLQSSYITYIRGQPPRGAFGALLRGLLCDDPEQRWGVQEVKRWLDGVLPPEPVTFQRYTVANSYDFAGRTYVNRRLMADALHHHFDAGIRELADPRFQAWVKHAVKEEAGTAAIEKIFDAKDSNHRQRMARRLNDGTLARVIQVLEPRGPIRFRSLSFMPDGLPGTVAQAISSGNEETLRDLQEMISRGYAQSAAELAAFPNTRLRRMASEMVGALRHGAHHGLGSGIERCLYDLNRELVCQSEKLEGHHVSGITDLMTALEALAAEDPDQTLLMDSHIAAFCASHGHDATNAINALSRTENRAVDRLLATLNLYAILQYRYGVNPLPNLARHLGEKLRPAIEELHHARTRDVLGRRLQHLIQDGNLMKLYDGLSFYKVRARDEQSFKDAKARFRQIERKIDTIERGFKPTDPIVAWYGQRFAIMAAYGVMLATGVLTFWNGF